MAHKIDNSKGFNSFIAYQKPAWHNLGKIFQEEITTEQALQESGANFQVLKLPNVHFLPNGSELISDSSFFTCRTDVNTILGDKLGKNYEVLQNAQALNIVDEILQAGRAKIETAGVLDDGKKVFICLKIIDRSIIVGSDDKTELYLLIATSHDGSMAITALITPVRVVCYNTLTAALNGAKNAIKIRHTANANTRLHEAMKVLKLIDEDFSILEDQYNTMLNTIISPEIMFNYFGTVFCTPDEIKEIQSGKRAKEVLSSQRQNILSDVARFAANGIGQAETMKGTDISMWTAYNAVTGYITGKKYANANDRANSMLFGQGAATIETAGILAAEPAKIQSMSKVNFSGLNLN